MRGKIPWERSISERNRTRTLELEVDASRTALVILDMQRAYTDPASGIGVTLRRSHSDIHGYYYKRLSQTVLPNILRLQEFFRGHELQIIYTKMGIQLPGAQDIPSWSWRRALTDLPQNYLYPNTSPEYELMADLEPHPNELVLDKNTLSPFNSTSLDQLLRNIGVDNLVIAGVLANASVESTAREAGDRGYNSIAVEDACAALRPEDHASFRNTQWWVVKTTEEVLRDFGPLLGQG